LSGLLTLANVDRRDSRFAVEQLDTLTAAAPDQIGPWVVTLCLEQRGTDREPVAAPARFDQTGWEKTALIIRARRRDGHAKAVSALGLAGLDARSGFLDRIRRVHCTTRQERDEQPQQRPYRCALATLLVTGTRIAHLRPARQYSSDQPTRDLLRLWYDP
jgi:hypothetical protein